MSRQQTQTEKSHDFVFSQHYSTASKLIGSVQSYQRISAKPGESAASLGTGEKTRSTQSGRLETVCEPTERAKELKGHRRPESEGAVAAGATGRTNAAVEVFLKLATFYKRSSGLDSNRHGLIAGLARKRQSSISSYLLARVSLAKEGVLAMTNAANTMTRRTLVVGAAACVICAPVIVRVASLMPVRGLPLQLPNLKRKVPKTMGEWYRLCFYQHLDKDLRAGRAMTYGPIGGKSISVAEGHQIIARARALGWLEP
jgi:hypothetical protein